ncbi:MAG: hypothetical protein HY644_07925 [Acidobacteria bacterium]|nr:hypothetical protein [Acidobacteriota bacterium]
MRRATLLSLPAVFLLAYSFSSAQKFRPDDPIQEDQDRLPIPVPKKVDVSQLYDFLENTFFRHAALAGQAQNINTLGEVPDSSWFTNRMGLRTVTIQELIRGPNQVDGPDASRPWVIIGGKSQGITPGFTIRDGRGDVYFLKFDALRNPQLATSAEVISSKFFHAFGYNVPEYYLAFMRPENLQISPDATLKVENGKRRKMSTKDVESLLKKVPWGPDGTIPVSASRGISGKELGPFKYWGARSDDPNDIFPHEDRRELRGLRIFAAWLNHDDARSINTDDFYVKAGDQGSVKHYLLDFGSSLGSGSVRVQSRRAGNEYILEWGPILKSALTLGLWDRPWRHVRYPEYPAVGRFESDFFHPARWKPEYPNPAFERMRNDDAFWATRILMRFTDEMIRAVVKTGLISDPQAEGYLADTLIRRRDKIVRYYLAQLNPLDAFHITGTEEVLKLDFKNLGAEAGVGEVDSYQYQWFRFDNETLGQDPLEGVQTAKVPSLPVVRHQAPYLMVRIRTLSRNQPQWGKRVDVFIRNGSHKSIVGIDREP